MNRPAASRPSAPPSSEPSSGPTAGPSLAGLLVGTLLTVPEAGRRLGISRQRVLQLIRAGTLDAAKPGRQYLITALSVQQRHQDRPPGRHQDRPPGRRQDTPPGRRELGQGSPR